MTLKLAKFEATDKIIQMLIDADIVKEQEENISISFLDEQLEDVREISNKRSQAGKEGAAKRWQKNSKSMANAKQVHSKDMANDGREDKRRVDKNRKETEKTPAQIIDSIKTHSLYQQGRAAAKSDGIDADREALSWAAWIIQNDMTELETGKLSANFLKWMNNASSRGGIKRTETEATRPSLRNQ